jgi:hypothetical protein
VRVQLLEEDREYKRGVDVRLVEYLKEGGVKSEYRIGVG